MRVEQSTPVTTTKQRRAGNALLAAIICSVITSLIIWAIPGFTIPAFTENPTMDTIIFVLGELFLWFVLWYWAFMVRDKVKRNFPR